MSKSNPFLSAVVCDWLIGGCAFSAERVSAAEAKPGWQNEWEKSVKAAEDEGALVIYMTQAFEPVFREVFQKKFPKIKVTTVTGRGPDLSQRVMSERARRVKGAKFFCLNPAWIEEIEAIREVIKKALARAGKGR